MSLMARHHTESSACTTPLTELGEESVYWSSRGVGSNWGMHDIRSHAIFKGLTPDMSGYVKTREDGEKAVRIFGGAYLDYRPSEPHYIQVKIGSADADTLWALHMLVRKNDNILTRRIIEQAIGVGDMIKDGRLQWTT